METNLPALLQEIESGQLDMALDLVIEAMVERRDTIRKSEARITALSLEVGDRVKLKALRPQYLNGHKATVRSITGVKVSIFLDRSVGKYSNGVSITIPANCCELLDEPRRSFEDYERGLGIRLVDSSQLDGPFLVEEAN